MVAGRRSVHLAILAREITYAHMQITPHTSRISFRTLISAISLYALIHFFFLWMYTNIDGYFYWAIGQYLKTGVYPFVSPFIYAMPITISPPLYGIFIAFIGSIPAGDIILHGIQILLMTTTTLLLYRLLLTSIKPYAATIISILFLLFPVNVIYTGSMMTELAAQTTMTIYLFLVYRFTKTKNISFLASAILLTGCMTLLKYQFVILFIFTISYLVVSFPKKQSLSHFNGLKVFFAVVVITTWIITNHSMTGVWGLSDTKKMPFYTNFVWDGRHFPKKTDPSVIALRQYVPPTADRYAEYWDLQGYILPYAHNDWRVVDELLGNVGIAAIKTYPIEYMLNGIRVFVQTLASHSPWWYNLQTFGSIDPVQPVNCTRLGTIQFCRPIIMTPWSYPIWNRYVAISAKIYNILVPLLLLFLFLPSLVITLLDKRIRIYSIIYLVSLVPISYLAMVESRYLIPYYPLIIIICVQGVKNARAILSRLANRMQTKKAKE